MARTGALEPGTVFARDYRVVRPLAQGGMGAVYVVEQISTRKRRALKLIKPDAAGLALDDGRAVERFVQEATVASDIQSEHVVQVIAAGVDDGTPWIVMELLEGEDLDARVAGAGPLGWDEAAELFAQLGHGLGAAHAAGVVHRDLKPENIFVARALRAGAPFTAKLLDFGIAKLLESAGTSARTSTVIGSPLWMAPEQFNAGAIRPCTDIWALGLLAFWTLTGRYYWTVANGESVAMTPLMTEQLFSPLVPATARARENGSDPGMLPPGFDAWFARAVVREPADRFADATTATASLLALFGRTGAAWQLASRPGGATDSRPPPSAWSDHRDAASQPAFVPSVHPSGPRASVPATARQSLGSGVLTPRMPAPKPASALGTDPTIAQNAVPTAPSKLPRIALSATALLVVALAAAFGATHWPRPHAPTLAPVPAHAVESAHLAPSPAPAAPAPVALPAAAPVATAPVPAVDTAKPPVQPAPRHRHVRTAPAAVALASPVPVAGPSPAVLVPFGAVHDERDEHGDVVHQSWGLPTRTTALAWSGVAYLTPSVQTCERSTTAYLASMLHDTQRAAQVRTQMLDAVRRALGVIQEERGHYATDAPVARHLDTEYGRAMQLVRQRCPDALH